MWPRLQEAPRGANARCPPQILVRLSKLCVQESASVRKSRKQQQRLLRNMSAHAVVLELLQIPYEKVGGAWGGRGLAGAGREVGGASWGATLTAGTLKRFPKLTEADPAS